MEEAPADSQRPRSVETKLLATSLEDSKWVVREWERLKLKYGNKFIAVLGCRVIAHHEDIKALMKIVDEKVPDKKDFVTTEFINLKEMRWLR